MDTVKPYELGELQYTTIGYRYRLISWNWKEDKLTAFRFVYSCYWTG